MEGSILHVHKAEFGLWASFANLEASAKHEYWKDANTASWHVRSHSCKKTVEENQNKSRQVCDECFKLTKSKSIVRMPLRFAKKFHAAELLNAKVFEGDEVVETVMKAIKASNLYKRDKATMDQLLGPGNGSTSAVCSHILPQRAFHLHGNAKVAAHGGEAMPSSQCGSNPRAVPADRAAVRVLDGFWA